MAVLYDEIRSLRRMVDHEADAQLAAEFDSLLKRVMGELSTSNSGVERANHVLRARLSLQLLCFEKANEYLSITD